MKIQLFILISALTLAACSGEDKTPINPSNSAATTTASTAQSAVNHNNPNWPTYLIGSEISYAPFEFKDKDGRPIGFEVDLLKAIGEREQFNAQFVNHKRGEAVETLNNGKFSIWASALSHSPERQASMDLSKPFIDAKLVIMILHTEKNQNIKNISDLKGKKIAINTNNSKSFIDMATNIAGGSDNLIHTNSFYLAMREVFANRATAVIVDSRVLGYYQTQNKTVPTRSIPIPDTKKDLVFAVKKGNTEMLNKLNRGLEKVKADGTYNQLMEKWFGHAHSNGK